MDNKVIMKLAAALVVTALAGTSLYGQDRNEVIKFYNEGAKSMQTDIPAAIKAFENVISLSETVGESVNDLKQKAVQVLPGLYVKIASTALNAKKPANEVLAAAKKAASVAEKYGNTTGKENAGKMLVSGYYNLGIEFFTKKDYDNAIKSFDSLLTINPAYTAAIYNKALVYRAQNNAPAFEETIDLFIEKVKAANDAERTKQASSLALEFFRAAGSQANQADKLDEAVTMLTKAAKYGDDKDLFYYFADVYNKQKKFDSGIEFAQKGLALETGNAEAKAKFFYQLAVAQAGKGLTAEACASFKNAMYGPFAEASKAQSKNLKCQ